MALIQRTVDRDDLLTKLRIREVALFSLIALTAVLANLPVAEYTALQVKQAVVGKGHARKEQVQEMVKRLLKLPGYPSTDAADALACAICHAHGGQGLGGLDTTGLKLRRGRLG